MFLFKHLLFLVFSISSLAWSQSAWVREGGVSGGGGNILNPQRPESAMDPEKAEHVVKASALYTKIFFEKAREQYLRGTVEASLVPVYKKLFEGPVDLQIVLNSIHPLVRDDGPCFDSLRQPVDASVLSPLPNRFCVSAFAIAQKVQPQNLPIEAAALMAHEYTELVGGDESDAVLIQKQVLKDLPLVNLPPLKSVHGCGDSNNE